jgi:serine/threonine protein kinase
MAHNMSRSEAIPDLLRCDAAGTLYSYVDANGRLSEPVARWFFQQMCLAVDYCHKKNVRVGAG